jgi:cell wall-associated NlpC family hydrolase
LKNAFNGLAGLFIVVCAFVVMGHPQTALAAKASTAQGVRKTTSSPTKKSTVKKAAVKKIALPPEKEADAASNAIASKAINQVGKRYVWGAMSPQRGFDCSGLVSYVYGTQGKKLPRTTHGLYQTLPKQKTLQVGDVIFFGRNNRVRHVGIYIGNGQIVHASTPGRGVLKDNLQTISIALGFMGAGRV